MAKDVRVIIDLNKPAGSIGFGYPLILAGMQTEAVAYTECANLDEVGDLFDNATDVYAAAKLIFMQNKAPQTIAVCGVTTNVLEALPTLKNLGWRQLIVTSVGTEGESEIKDIAEWVETTPDKFYFTSAVLPAPSLPKLGVLDRTALFAYDGSVDYPEAALVGATAGKAPGSFTYKNMILKGLDPLDLTDGEIKAIHEAGAFTFVKKAGDNVTTEGKTCGGEYIDIIDSEDWVIQQIEYRTQKVLNQNDKVPYDNNGIAMLENVCVGVLKEAFDNGIIAVDDDGQPDYSTNYKPRSETNGSDRVARKYVEGNFRFALAGAIHEAEIHGVIDI